jgi:bacillithiol system protein YtxJ
MPKVDLTELIELEDLERLLDRSEDRPQLLFKHSLTCPISDAAHRAFQEYLGAAPDERVEYAWLAVQKARPVSGAVAERVGIRHESPQALLIHEGKAVWHASHWDITAQSLSQAVQAQSLVAE